MRIIPTALLAGAGSLVIAGSAAAESLPAHTMTIQLPDGSIEEIHYTGDTAPQIDVVPAISAIAAPSPFWAFGPNSPFAAMEQISAAMDRETAALLQETQTLAATQFPGFDGLIQVDRRNLPPGAQSYSFVATLSPGGVCTRSVEITSTVAGAKPQIVSRSSGNCGAAANAATPDVSPASRPGAEIRSAKYDGAQEATAPVRQVSWQNF